MVYFYQNLNYLNSFLISLEDIQKFILENTSKRREQYESKNPKVKKLVNNRDNNVNHHDDDDVSLPFIIKTENNVQNNGAKNNGTKKLLTKKNKKVFYIELKINSIKNN